MKTFSKVLSMFLVVVMCFGLFAASAFADFDFGTENNGGFAASENPASDGTFNFDGGFSTAVSESFEAPAAPAAETDTFALNIEEPAVEVAVEAAEDDNKKADGTIDFEMETADTFNTPYSQLTEPVKFKFEPTSISKSAPEDIKITVTSGGGDMDGDTFPAGLAYSTSATGSNLISLVAGSQYKMETKTMTLLKEWLATLTPGTYYVYGKRYEDVPVKLGFFNVNAGSYGKFAIVNSPYDKNDPNSPFIYATSDPVDPSEIPNMKGFGVAAVSGSYTHVLSVNEYERSSSGKAVHLLKRYLDNLNDGEYYLIGFPTQGSTSDQVIMGTFIVKSGDYPLVGKAKLTPDYQMWYGGTDPLSFYSQIHDMAGNDWNYKGYGIDVIVPDIIVSTRSSMAGATSVRIDQYWDLGYGYIMLGTNFLNSLSPEETYYMQVIDARHPDKLYSNVVSFRVGPTLRAIDTDKHVINSTRSLRFRSSSPVSEVYVGNIPLTDAADYGVSWDGKTVTLSFEFLNKRTPGNTYTIKVRTTDGNYASTTFQVLTTAQGSASPRTGDESNLGLWAAFLLLSGTAVVVLVPKLRKHDI